MLDLSRQFATLREEIMAVVARVCESQCFILGPEVASFECAAGLACGAPHGIGCASGTDALWLAMAAAGVGESACGKQEPAAVITSPFSFFATAGSILRLGARVLFADIDPATFNLSPDAVRTLLRTHTGEPVKAVLPVHLYGQCADWDGFTQLQQENPGLLLIEDAAQAFGATWKGGAAEKGRPAGSLGDAACFSFYPTKNLSAFGDAVLVTTGSAAIDARARSLRSHGMTRRYFHDEVGCNSRLDEIQAAILKVKLQHLPRWNQRRRELAARYNELFLAAGLAAPRTAEGIVLPWTDPRAGHVFHQYVIRAPRRDELHQHLTARGIGSEIYYPLPLHLQQSLKSLGYEPGDFPVSERAAAEVLALPIYPELREDEQQMVVAAIRGFYA